MRAKRGAWLVAALLVASGCAPWSRPGVNLEYAPQAGAGPEPENGPEQESRLYRRQQVREEVTGAGPWHLPPEEGPLAARGVAEPAQQRALLTQQALLEAVDGVWASTAEVASRLPRLARGGQGLGGGAGGAFEHHSVYAQQQLRWIHETLAAVATLSQEAAQVGDAQMELALLRLVGPRLQAAMSAAVLVNAWYSFLKLADVVLTRYRFYSVETLVVDMERVRQRLEPALRALASQQPALVEASAQALPELMNQLGVEFQDIQQRVQVATHNGGQVLLAAQVVEMLTLATAMKLTLPRIPPAAPLVLELGLGAQAGGVMVGSQLVVSAQWVESMRQLVQAGVISAPAVSAAVRIHAGQTLMAQAPGDLPPGVRQALGDGPEVRGMKVTDRAGAGMGEAPQHHVLPQEHRPWFEQRGFTGDFSIDQFCVKLDQAEHQAIHGGGNWRLGRLWPGEWNQMIMKALLRAETRFGRMLTRNEILTIVAERMNDYKIPMNFTPWRGR